MNIKILLGILLVIVGLVATVAGITRVDPQQVREDETQVVGDQNEPRRAEARSIMLPVVAGLSIAGGAALIGLGMGRFRRPRIVAPDSPNADEAATSRPPETKFGSDKD